MPVRMHRFRRPINFILTLALLLASTLGMMHGSLHAPGLQHFETALEGRVAILNLFDKVYLLRDGTGIGVGVGAAWNSANALCGDDDAFLEYAAGTSSTVKPIPWSSFIWTPNSAC
jgi:hypothetical protein